MSTRNKWLQAERIFRDNINASVICPSCERGVLLIQDVAFDESDIEKGGERIIRCPECNQLEIMLYRIPPPNWFSKSLD